MSSWLSSTNAKEIGILYLLLTVYVVKVISLNSNILVYLHLTNLATIFKYVHELNIVVLIWSFISTCIFFLICLDNLRFNPKKIITNLFLFLKYIKNIFLYIKKGLNEFFIIVY